MLNVSVLIVDYIYACYLSACLPVCAVVWCGVVCGVVWLFWSRSVDFLKGKLIRLQHELEVERKVEEGLTQDLATAE